MESENKSKSKSKSNSKSKSHSNSKSKSKSKSHSSSKSGSKKAVRSPRVFAIIEGRKLPKFPKNAVFPDSQFAKDEKLRLSNHSMNPIVHWPEPRSKMGAADRNIGCHAHNLPYNVRARLTALNARDIGCRGITLKINGQYTIFGTNNQNYVVGDEYAYGKKKRKGNRTKGNRTKKNKTKKMN